MAADEVLLRRVGADESPPTLRFYQWDPPTISLGCFQKYAEYEALPPPAGDLPVVRRLTGGGAILHDRELTYSLTLPLGHPLLAGGPNRLYELAQDVIIACLAETGLEAWRGCEGDDSGAAKGPFFCFARRHPYDVLIGQDKVAGSAQRRTRAAVLQHGSIILERRYEQQTAAGAGTDVEKTAEHFASAFTVRTDCHLRNDRWTSAEREEIDALEDKYTGKQWTQRA